ncbi:MAG: DUF2244 domain-containing protein [Pseudomonadota bacterium]
MSFDTKPLISRFVVKPNCSMSWRDNQILIASLAIISFGLATGFALQGLWVILPFAGAEILFLFGALYYCSLKATQREVISINANDVLIETGRDRAKQSHKLQRAWTSVQLYPEMPPQPGRLVMRSKGKEYEIGACLTEEERKSLAQSIKQALIEKV